MLKPGQLVEGLIGGHAVLLTDSDAQNNYYINKHKD